MIFIACAHEPHAAHSAPVVSCTLLVVSLGAGATACGGSDGNPLSAKPYDAARPGRLQRARSGSKKADPDKPLEVTAKGDDGRITDVTATDAAGRYLRANSPPTAARWRSTAPLAAGARYTVRVSTEDEDGAPGRRTLTFDTAPAKRRPDGHASARRRARTASASPSPPS